MHVGERVCVELVSWSWSHIPPSSRTPCRDRHPGLPRLPGSARCTRPRRAPTRPPPAVGRPYSPVALDDLEDMVLGLEARDHQVILAGRRDRARRAARPPGPQDRGTVGDQHGRRSELGPVVVLDADARPRSGRPTSAPPAPRPSGSSDCPSAPLGPPPLETVDVGGERDATRPQDRQQRRIRGVEHDGASTSPRDRVGHRQRRVARSRGGSSRTGRCTRFMPEVLGHARRPSPSGSRQNTITSYPRPPAAGRPPRRRSRSRRTGPAHPSSRSVRSTSTPGHPLRQPRAQVVRRSHRRRSLLRQAFCGP